MRGLSSAGIALIALTLSACTPGAPNDEAAEHGAAAKADYERSRGDRVEARDHPPT